MNTQPTIMPADHRFASFPLPLVLPIVGATSFALVGALLDDAFLCRLFRLVRISRRHSVPGSVGCGPDE
jgi:hypothetical protein